MGQVRILDREDSERKPLYQSWKFRWCKKDGRFEKTSKDPEAVIAKIIEEYPDIKLSFKK